MRNKPSLFIIHMGAGPPQIRGKMDSRKPLDLTGLDLLPVSVVASPTVCKLVDMARTAGKRESGERASNQLGSLSWHKLVHFRAVAYIAAHM